MRYNRGKMLGEARFEPEFEEKIIQINRVSTKTKGGNRIGFSILTVVGNKKGRVGIGLGKAPTVREAIGKGFNRARKHLVTVSLQGTTIPHRVLIKKGAARVLLKPAPEGTGLKTGGAVRAVAEAAGIRDLVSKILGTKNRASNVYATFDALKSLRPVAEVVAARRSKERLVKTTQSTKAAKLGKSVRVVVAAKSEDKQLVSDLELSVRTRNALIRAGIKTKDQLKSMSGEKVLAVKGLGKKGLGEIKSIIQ